MKNCCLLLQSWFTVPCLASIFISFFGSHACSLKHPTCDFFQHTYIPIPLKAIKFLSRWNSVSQPVNRAMWISKNCYNYLYILIYLYIENTSFFRRSMAIIKAMSENYKVFLSFPRSLNRKRGWSSIVSNERAREYSQKIVESSITYKT